MQAHSNAKPSDSPLRKGTTATYLLNVSDLTTTQEITLLDNTASSNPPLAFYAISPREDHKLVFYYAGKCYLKRL